MLGKINTNPTKLIHWQPCGDDFTYWAVIKRDTVSARVLGRDDGWGPVNDPEPPAAHPPSPRSRS
jgi:hypothetical protein